MQQAHDLIDDILHNTARWHGAAIAGALIAFAVLELTRELARAREARDARGES